MCGGWKSEERKQRWREEGSGGGKKRGEEEDEMKSVPYLYIGGSVNEVCGRLHAFHRVLLFYLFNFIPFTGAVRRAVGIHATRATPTGGCKNTRGRRQWRMNTPLTGNLWPRISASSLENTHVSRHTKYLELVGAASVHAEQLSGQRTKVSASGQLYL